jgi:phosphate ABC transporter phosphate-binding protein
MAAQVVALAALGGVLLTVSGCGGGDSGQARELPAGGSTFVDPMMRKWAGIYDKEKGIKIDYTGGGSGKGISEMSSGNFAFGCTDAPMTAEELKTATQKGGNVLHIPLIVGSLCPVYHLENVKERVTFSGPVLVGIYLGKITKWNDDALKELNKDVNLPNKAIKVVHRSDPSGSSFIWTSYLSAVSKDWADEYGASKEVKWPTGEGAKGSDGVADQVKANDGTIGYVETLYALNKNIQFGSVRNQSGKDVLGDDMEAVEAAAQEKKEIPDDLCLTFVDAPGEKSYPICGVVWAVLYVNQPADRRKTLIDFLHWATHDGQREAASLHYATLPPALVEKIDKKLETIRDK